MVNEWAEFLLDRVGFLWASGRQMWDTNRGVCAKWRCAGVISTSLCAGYWSAAGNTVPLWQVCQRDNARHMLARCLCVRCVDVCIISDSIYVFCMFCALISTCMRSLCLLLTNTHLTSELEPFFLFFFFVPTWYAGQAACASTDSGSSLLIKSPDDVQSVVFDV